MSVCDGWSSSCLSLIQHGGRAGLVVRTGGGDGWMREGGDGGAIELLGGNT